MAEFLDSEAVLSEGEEDFDHPRKRKTKKMMVESDDDEEEEDDEKRLREELQDLIDDAPIDESDIESGGEKSRKRRKSDDYDDRLEDDDFDLIEENLGITVERRRYKRLKKIQDKESDDEEEQEVSKERETIANELFEGGSGDEDDRRSEISHRPPPETYEDDSGGESSDADDFIVDEEGRPIGEKRQKRRAIYSNPALQQAQDIFGINFDYDEFEKYGEDEPDEGEDEGGAASKRRKSDTRKRTRKSIFDIYEPSELKRGHFTDIDNEIRNTDIPERMQLRSVPVTQVPEGSDELNHESEWIYQQAFNRPTISVQNAQSNADQESADKGPQIVPKIKKVLDMMRNNYLEVPFISFYRKECITPELNMNDLWKIYKFDAKWCELRQRKAKLLALFEKMRNFQLDEIMKNPDAPLSDSLRVIKEDDIDRLKNIQTNEELNDVHHHFMLYYSHDIPAMQEMARKQERGAKRLEKIEKRQKRLLEAEENGEDLPSEDEIEIEEEDNAVETMKQAVRTGPYAICRKAGLDTFAKKFGLTPEHFAENLRDNYQRHEVDQEPVEPSVVALDYIGLKFNTSDEVLKAVQLMVAIQLARDPLVRKCVREMYMERAKVTVRPTKKGLKEIDENHPIYTIKYLRDKPVNELSDDQFLKLSIAEEDKLITITFSDNIDGNSSSDYIDEIKQLYIRDEFSKNVQDWNTLRVGSVEIALTRMIIPDMKNELKSNLLAESKGYVMRMCCQKMYNWIKIAPYSCDYSQEESEEWDTSEGMRVMGISYVPDYSQAAFACIIAPNGFCTGFLKLPHLFKRKNSFREDEKVLKEADLLALKNFISSKKPHVIVIGGESREALMVSDDVKECLMTLCGEEQFPIIPVEILDNNLAKIYAKSTRGVAEFREYPEQLREAISLARRLQNPLVEFSQLCTADEEILCLKYHTLQDQLPKEELLENLYLEFVNRVNEVGLDVNKAIQLSHMENLVQFICGLGPRKGAAMVKILKQTIRRLENRSQLVTACHMGPKVYINCAGFIKIDTDSLGDSTEAYVEVLDGTRIHPETYEWAKKMAVDALEYDDEDPNTAGAVEEILKTPDRLQELDLDAFAEELERQGCGNKCVTLYDIRSELNNRYKDLRSPFESPTPEELFDILTKETPETFYIGKLVLATVIGISHRKPDRDQLDQANPVRNDETGLWQCPFCLVNDFAEMSEVWNHFDVGSCPGKANGVRLRLENGLSGYIHIKNLSDSHVGNPQERVIVGQVIHCRATKIDVEKFSIECSSKTSDLADQNNEFRPAKDACYDAEAEEEDLKVEDDTKKVKHRQVYVKRLNFHPLFHNISYIEAQKLMGTMKQGDAIVRPSSKGSDHLTVTWKISDDICQHIDVREEGKDNAFSLGQKLWIGNEEFEDLDEIIARHVNPMAGYVSELMDYKKYKTGIDGVISEADKVLKALKKADPKSIPYIISAAKNYPGKFLLSYLPRISCKHEYLSITPEGFRYRSQVFGRIDDLIRWFKQHFRDPIPIQNTPYGGLNSRTPGSIPSMDSEAINRVAQNLPHHMLHSLSQAANRTPHYPPQTPASYGGNLTHPNTPYTPSAETPFMTPYQTQQTPRYGQQAPSHQFAYSGAVASMNPKSIPENNADNDSFDWGTAASTQSATQGMHQASTYSNQPMNNADNDSFDWGGAGTTQSTNQNMQEKSTSYSRRSDSSDNGGRGGRSNWKPRGNMRGNMRGSSRGNSRGNFRGRGQNMHQRSTPYSRPSTSTDNADNDSFDWGSASQTISSTEQPNKTNNNDDDMFDWGTGAAATNQSESSTNIAEDNTDDWQTGSATQAPRKNMNQRSKPYSRQPAQVNNADDSFDWGTASQLTPSTEKPNSTNNGDDNMFDWGTGAEATRPNEPTTNNTADDWETGGSAQQTNRNSYQKSTPWSQRSNSRNNGDNDTSDWQSGASAQSTNQNMRRKSTSYSRGPNPRYNGNNNSSDWQTGGRGRPARQNMNRRSAPSSYQPASNDTADDDSFDWGTAAGTQSTSQNTDQRSTSLSRHSAVTNNGDEDMFDWGTGQGETNVSVATVNDADNDASNWQTGAATQPPRRNNFRRSMPPPRQSPLKNYGDADMFDWGTGTSGSNTSETPNNNVDKDTSDWQTGGAVAQPTRQNNNRRSLPSPRRSPPKSYGDTDMFDWGTAANTSSQSETPTNNTDDTSDWQTGANSHSMNQITPQRSTSYSRYSTPKNNTEEGGQSRWQRGRNNRGRGQNLDRRSTPYTRRPTPIKSADNDSPGWGSDTGGHRGRHNMRQRSTPYSRQPAPTNNADDDSFDWGTATQVQSTSRNSHQESTSSSWGGASKNNENDDMFDWGTGTGSSVKNEKSTNNVDNDQSDWQTGAGASAIPTKTENMMGGDATPLYDEN